MGHELLIPTSSQATWVADSVLGTRAGEKSLCSGSSESAGEDQQVPAQDALRVGVTGIDCNVQPASQGGVVQGHPRAKS